MIHGLDIRLVSITKKWQINFECKFALRDENMQKNKEILTYFGKVRKKTKKNKKNKVSGTYGPHFAKTLKKTQKKQKKQKNVVTNYFFV